MNNNAKKWVEALRSGEYQQTTKNLHDKNGFCCLGVACDLYGKEKGIEWEAPKVQGDTGLQFIGSEAILPSLVKEWLGLRDNGSYYYTLIAGRELYPRSNKSYPSKLQGRPPALISG